MADNLTPAQRLSCMRRNVSSGTSPERRLRKSLWAIGLRYRLRYGLPGKPDLVFPGPRVAVFVDGCFWHGCPEHCRRPLTNTVYWNWKLDKNLTRDRKTTEELQRQ